MNKFCLKSLISKSSFRTQNCTGRGSEKYIVFRIFDASEIFDELAEKPLMSPLAKRDETYVCKLAIIVKFTNFFQVFLLFFIFISCVFVIRNKLHVINNNI